MTHTHVIRGGEPARPDFRRQRQIGRNVRLHEQLRDLVHAHPEAAYIGANGAVEGIAYSLGFAPHDLCVVDVQLAGKVVTLVCVPHQHWNRPASMAKVLDLRFQAKAAGHLVVLVPQSIVERQPRLGNAEIIARTAKVRVDSASRMIVLAHLIEHGDTSLSELAGLIQHSDPFAAILHLVAVGAVAIDLERAITPSSLVGIPSARLMD